MEQENIKNNNSTLLDEGLDKLKNFSSKFDGNQNVIEQRKFNKKIVGVYGSAGGVGVSSFIEELAVLFADNNFNVLIIDGNFLFPYHQLYYFDKKEEGKESFIEVLNSPVDKIYKIIEKSDYNNKICYAYQDFINFIDLLKLDEDFTNFEKTQNKLLEYRKTYDVVLIDLNTNLLSNCIEQAFLKNCDYLINIKDASVKSVFFEEELEKLILLTAKLDIPILKIENKVIDKNKEPLYLPYEPFFHETFNEAKSFLIKGKSLSTKYLNNFQLIFETIINNLYK